MTCFTCVWNSLQFSQHLAKRSTGHLLHLNIEPLPSPVSVILLFYLPQDCSDEEESEETSGKSYEKLKQVQLWVLGERDNDPKRRLEVVDINVERCVLLTSKCIIALRESVLEVGTVLLRQNNVLLFPLLAGMSVSQVHPSCHGTGY